MKFEMWLNKGNKGKRRKVRFTAIFPNQIQLGVKGSETPFVTMTSKQMTEFALTILDQQPALKLAAHKGMRKLARMVLAVDEEDS